MQRSPRGDRIGLRICQNHRGFGAIGLKEAEPIWSRDIPA